MYTLVIESRVLHAFRFITQILGHTHFQLSTTQEKTLAAKSVFEKIANSHGVHVKKYHADNGRFAKEGFKDAVAASNQTITLWGVGAHHQNGIVEYYIGLLTTGAQSNLLHAKRFWPEAITTILWPFTMKCVQL